MAQPIEPLRSRALPVELREALQTFDASGASSLIEGLEEPTNRTRSPETFPFETGTFNISLDCARQMPLIQINANPL